MRPSFILQIISGFLILYSVLLISETYKTYLVDKDKYKLIIIVFLASIAFGIHGIQHSIEEIHYNFNPLEGNWGKRDEEEEEDYD
jgi:hypothetical protein